MPLVAKVAVGVAVAGPVAVTVPAPTAAFAATSSRLLYSRGAGAESCPDGDALRGAVARLVGYDPFVAFARMTVVVAIERDDAGLRARIYLDDTTSSVVRSAAATPHQPCSHRHSR